MTETDKTRNFPDVWLASSGRLFWNPLSPNSFGDDQISAVSPSPALLLTPILVSIGYLARIHQSRLDSIVVDMLSSVTQFTTRKVVGSVSVGHLSTCSLFHTHCRLTKFKLNLGNSGHVSLAFAASTLPCRRTLTLLSHSYSWSLC